MSKEVKVGQIGDLVKSVIDKTLEKYFSEQTRERQGKIENLEFTINADIGDLCIDLKLLDGEVFQYSVTDLANDSFNVNGKEFAESEELSITPYSAKIRSSSTPDIKLDDVEKQYSWK